MNLIYEEPQSIGGVLKIYQDRIIYKAGYLNPKQTILIKHIVSVSLASLMPQVILETAGSQKFVIITSNKEKVQEIILNAINGITEPSLKPEQVLSHSPIDESNKTEINQQNEKPNNKKSTVIAVVVFVIIILFFIFLSWSDSPSGQNSSQSTQVSQQDKDAAQKELTEFMGLAKSAGLVASYDFSETGNIVYVGNIWYTQTVQFKKDFLAKIAMLKEKITGYHRFEVRDAYSNEKVAEVTAFSGSLEVYK